MPVGAGGDALGAVFAALADPTRRLVLSTLIAEGATTVPALTARLPMSRQAVAKHMATLGAAGLVTGDRGTGREIRYRLAPGAIAPAAAWIREAEAAWDGRLERLRRRVEEG